MTQKTISINPALFTFGKKTKKENKTKKEKKPMSIITPNSLKNKFIEKVKQHQRKKDKNSTRKKKESEFGSDFQESLRYLSNLIDENDKNDTSKFNVTNNLNKLESFQNDNYLRENVNVDLPSDLKKPETIYNRDVLKPETNINIISNDNLTPKPYGCLKNGDKPTYRQWLHTRKRPFKQKKTNIITDLPRNEKLNIREEKLNAVKSMFIKNENDNTEKNILQSDDNVENKDNEDSKINIEFNDNNDNNESINLKPKQRYAIKKSISRKYTCGKNNKSRKVAIMIKSGETRAKIIREKRNLTRRNIHDVKNYLHKNGFLKVGSSAPKKILMDMYEACILTGKVANINDRIQIHNFLNENK